MSDETETEKKSESQSESDERHKVLQWTVSLSDHDMDMLHDLVDEKYSDMTDKDEDDMDDDEKEELESWSRITDALTGAHQSK
jgi:hypothetical protein